MSVVDLGFVKEQFGDVTFECTVELGRVYASLGDMLSWDVGTIIKLTKTSGEPADFLVNNRPLALAEVMVLDDAFGVRIAEILTKEMITEKYKEGLYG